MQIRVSWNFWCAINNAVSTKLFSLSAVSWYWIIYSAYFPRCSSSKESVLWGLTVFISNEKEGRKQNRKRHATKELLSLFKHTAKEKRGLFEYFTSLDYGTTVESSKIITLPTQKNEVKACQNSTMNDLTWMKWVSTEPTCYEVW